MRRRLLLWAAVAGLVLPVISQTGRDSLETGFLNPPREARLRCYWWWLNGNTNEAAITRDLEQMKLNGYGGALLVDANGSEQQNNRMVPAGPTFASDRWRQLYRHALKEAARLDLEISLNIESGWNLGGPTVKPEQGAKLLTWSRTAVQGGAEVRRALPRPPAKIDYYRDVAVLAYPLHHGEALPARPIRQLAVKSASQELGMSAPVTAPLLEDIAGQPGEQDARIAEVIDVTSNMQPDGSFAWQAPAGTWEILRLGYMASGARVSTSSGAWQGLAIDYLDRAELENYWREHIDPLLADAKPYLGKTLRYLVTDSWELGGVNWTGNFREEFRRRRGYDPLPYLPIVAGRLLEDRETSNRFLNDFRRTVGDLVIAGHYQVFAELAARSGLGIHPESGGPHGAPLDALETLGVSTFPQMEFWARSATHRVKDEERFFVKQGSSAAHTYGKTLVAAEGMTSIGPQWEESIWNNLKPTFDQAVCEGLNRLIWHTFTSSPKDAGLPGQEYFAGTHLNPNVTWWKQAPAFLGYTNRSQFLMQQGVPVSDVLVYYGDQVPNFVQNKAADPAQVLPGYDYDVIDEHALAQRTSARDGRIVLPEGTAYQVLVLPDRPSISLAALAAVQKLVAGGAAVIGPKPQRTTGLGDDRAVRSIADQVWGKVYTGQTTRAVLQSRGIKPDFEGPQQMEYVHRRAGDADIYFVRNSRPEPLYAEVTLRVRGKAPELWHAESGQIDPASIYHATPDGRTKMPLWLEPNGSVFIVLRKPAAAHLVQISRNGASLSAESEVRVAAGELVTRAGGRYEATSAAGKTVTVDVPTAAPLYPLEGAWTVRFAPGWGAPAQTSFDTLRSWTELTDPGIKYFSGTARYAKKIEIPQELLQSGRELWLDLGDVREIAEVWWNGKPLGVLWKKPFEVALGAAARAGSNDLAIEVTNLWPNRLIGDQQLPPEKRLTSTNITKFTATSPLMPSGLLGPVTLRTAYRVKLAY